jgi:hypothetical protein
VFNRHTTLIVWTVFGQPTGQPTGTNNEVEGLHHHLNKKNGYQTPPSYKPIERLNTEASLLPVQHEFVSEDKLQRYLWRIPEYPEKTTDLPKVTD